MNTFSKNPIYVHGYGCVSSAGLSAADLYQCCSLAVPVESQPLERRLGDQTITSRVRAVDKLALKKLLPKHPRLRRSSSITKFIMAAALQALNQQRLEQISHGEFRLGIVVSFFNGCINYSNRFYSEVLDDPKLTSPILFPETVFNAPASHVASYLNSEGPVYTLIGDSSVFLSAMQVATDWLNSDLVDGCLVLSGEELDWLSAEALTYYSPSLEATEGASAIYLEREPAHIVLDHLSQAHHYTCQAERAEALRNAFSSIECESNALLVDGLADIEPLDRDEHALVKSWTGDRMSPLSTLGFGMGASSGFQTMAALEALKHGKTSSVVLASGSNQQAYSAHFKQLADE